MLEMRGLLSIMSQGKQRGNLFLCVVIDAVYGEPTADLFSTNLKKKKTVLSKLGGILPSVPMNNAVRTGMIPLNQ